MLRRKKIKTVSFRLSSEDYASFQQACEVYGFGTVSEFARRSMQSFVDQRAHVVQGSELQTLWQQVEFLTGEVSRLSNALGLGAR
jgi:hypothetical protein